MLGKLVCRSGVDALDGFVTKYTFLVAVGPDTRSCIKVGPVLSFFPSAGSHERTPLKSALFCPSSHSRIFLRSAGPTSMETAISPASGKVSWRAVFRSHDPRLPRSYDPVLSRSASQHSSEHLLNPTNSHKYPASDILCLVAYVCMVRTE